MTGMTQPDAHERILSAAYDLFSQRGVRDVGVDELIARSGVANATFYRHFPSKDLLVLAFLERREEMGPEHSLGQASIMHLSNERDTIRKHAELAGLADPEGLARSLQILMKGAIVGARMGDREAAHSAKEMAGWLIDHREIDHRSRVAGD
jgi:AcrR family transcriptional regulator